MSAESMEIWKNVALSLIPSGIFLAVGIMLLKRMRNWYTIVLVVAAALNILLPIVSQTIINDVKDTAATINALSTQQEKEAAVKQAQPYLKQAEIYLKWLNDGRYISMLAFAIMLVIAVGMLVPKGKVAISPGISAAMDKSAAP
jgi:hypothetical protein